MLSRKEYNKILNREKSSFEDKSIYGGESPSLHTQKLHNEELEKKLKRELDFNKKSDGVSLDNIAFPLKPKFRKKKNKKSIKRCRCK